MAEYRCPVDDKIYTGAAPDRDGSPDCDGPKCKEKFAEKKDPSATDPAPVTDPPDKPPHP